MRFASTCTVFHKFRDTSGAILLKLAKFEKDPLFYFQKDRFMLANVLLIVSKLITILLSL